MIIIAGISAIALVGVIIGVRTYQKAKVPQYSTFEVIDEAEIKRLGLEKIGNSNAKPIVDEPHTLIANAKTEEEAKEIAELYEMELLRFQNNVALFRTDKDPAELIQWGKEQGYPTIGINYKYTVN